MLVFNIIFEKVVVTLSRVNLILSHFEENKFIFRYEMKSGVCYFSLIVAETKDASFKPILSCFKLILINIITATINDLKV